MAASDAPVRSSAFDCLLRGFCSLRANWQLVPLLWVQQVAVVVLLVAGLVALVLPFGLGPLPLEELTALSPPELEALLLELLARPYSLLVPLLTGLLASSLVGLVGCLVYCWFQGGVMAVLREGEHRVEPGPPPGWQGFAAFAGRAFTAGAGRLTLPYFWLVNLYLVVVLVLMLPWTGILVLAVRGGETWGPGAAVGIGCAGSLPLGVLVVIAGLWYLLAQAELPRPGADVRGASRRGLALLRRRPGAVLLVVVVFVSVNLVVGVGLSPLGLVLVPLLKAAPALYWLGQAGVYALQLLVGGAVNVAFLAATVALVRDGEGDDTGAGQGRPATPGIAAEGAP